MSRSAGATSEPSRVLRSPTVARTLAWSAALGCLLFAPSLLAQTASGTATADDVPGDEETAEDGEVIGASRSQRDLRRPGTPDLSAYRSDQFGAFELRFGPYVPDVDDEFDGRATPYEDLFGTSQRYSIGFEVDWQALRIPYLGSLGPGFSLGYTRSSGRAPFTSGEGFSAETTSLWILPAAVLAVLRVDVLAQRFSIPLVPYAKVGFSYALWSIGGGDGVDRYEGLVGRGAETGYQGAVGLMFWLNVLHPQSALDMDNATGINSSYVFGELFTSDIDSFGTGMQVGTTSWVVGLAFEF
ncbi:MAG: hypothetical protein GX607_07545 [Myxococcales bacterium]|jgi:hypothetical protein|nr:hypothetical protein [Myxococcales bacterium]